MFSTTIQKGSEYILLSLSVLFLLRVEGFQEEPIQVHGLV